MRGHLETLEDGTPITIQELVMGHMGCTSLDGLFGSSSASHRLLFAPGDVDALTLGLNLEEIV
jgi:hypothetical protein